jgi:3',5'-cyclic AMP phosphodiesterase CpdA
MIIAQISDTHILARMSDEPHASSRAENLRRCIADINRQDVDAVIHTGDTVHHGTADEYAHLREILAELRAPLFVTPGNRDRHSAIRVAFDNLNYLARTGSFLHYAIEDYPVRLVALDSVSTGERKGVFCAERRAWLEQTLAKEPHKPTILFIHHPPFNVGDDYVAGYRQPRHADDLAAVVRRYPQVQRLLCGHVHRFHHEAWAGTIATIIPSVAVDLRKDVDAALGDAPLYVLHTWSVERGLDSRMQAVGVEMQAECIAEGANSDDPDRPAGFSCENLRG